MAHPTFFTEAVRLMIHLKNRRRGPTRVEVTAASSSCCASCNVIGLLQWEQDTSRCLLLSRGLYLDSLLKASSAATL